MAIIIPFIKKIISWNRQRINKYRFILVENSKCKSIIVGQRNLFNVPILSRGVGSISIGIKNTFGFRLAPMLGDGEILLQTRTPESKLIIGNRNDFSNNISIIARQEIIIKDNCLFGDQVYIIDSDFHGINSAERRSSPGITKAVIIGNNVLLGSRVMVLKGVSIGDNTVVGAMSVVIKSLPPNCIAAGNPAKIIRRISG
jgi:acetyltransferase-like isoleucine patch superfamily enzyme